MTRDWDGGGEWIRKSGEHLHYRHLPLFGIIQYYMLTLMVVKSSSPFKFILIPDRQLY
ncbi:MAG: hypothetical protein PUB29_07115 [Bacteroidales bacterium]|nr:hypothetical protein [Bacteroidales bacterium]